MSASIYESSSRSPLVPGREHRPPSPTAEPSPPAATVQESLSEHPQSQDAPLSSPRADRFTPRRFAERIPVPELTHQSLSTNAIPMEYIPSSDITDNYALSQVSTSPVSLHRLRHDLSVSNGHDGQVLSFASTQHRQQSAELFQYSAGPPGLGDLSKDQAAESIDMEVPLVNAGGSGTYTGYTLSRKRMAALAEVDSAFFSRFHFKVVFIAGIGFFVDAYDIFSINIASTMLAYVHTQGNCVRFPGSQNAVIKAATPVGNLVGQIGFGWLADRVGRKRTYGIELVLIIIGAIGQALISDDRLGTVNLIGTLFIWRFIMGLGIGGDYPLSAVISSEFAPVHVRGRMLTAVFANQGWGQLLASVVGCILTVIFGKHLQHESPTDPKVLMAIDRAWRILVSLGCLPAAIGIYSRLTIPETPRFTMDIERNVRQAAADIDVFLRTGGFHYDPDSVVIRAVAPKASPGDFWRYITRWPNLKVLIGCAYSWFAIDITFYGIGLNTDTFYNAIGFIAQPDGTAVSGCKWDPNDPTPQNLLNFKDAGGVFTYLINLCTANMLLSATGLIPGYWVTFVLIDHPKVGRRKIQLMGFTMLAILFLIMALVFPRLVGKHPPLANTIFDLSPGAGGFIALFVITSFFQNFGPNTTTFIIPGEMFPTRYRSTCFGIAAACGKVGAIVSQFALGLPITQVQNIMFAYVPFVVGGIGSTLLLPETRDTSLEDNSHEDQDVYIRGIVHRDISAGR